MNETERKGFTTAMLFDLKQSIAGEQLANYLFPWEIVPNIAAIIKEIGAALEESQYIRKGSDIWIHKSAQLADTVSIAGPCIIGANTIIRHGSLIRGSALIGADCTIGNSVEIKNAILFNHVSLGHFNYVGDSVLGYKAHFGAGAIASNVRLDKATIKIKLEEPMDTGLEKLGALIGDMAEIGCNSVLNPGTIIGKNSTVFPLSCVVGVIAPNSVVKRS